MGWEAWFTAGLIAAMLAVLARGKHSTDMVMLAVLGVFLAVGIVDPAEAFRGFGNTGLMTVAFLYVVATGLQETGGMGLLTARVLGRPTTAGSAMARLIPPVAALSAFMNNTPLVAMFIPVIRDLCKRTRIPAAKLMMPLSFAAILGGVCTLIGTSTNLVVFSLIEGRNKSLPAGAAPLEQMGMWTITAVGLPVAIVGVVYMLLARRLLPDRPEDAQGDGARDYMAAMSVPAGSPLIGRTIEEAGLRHLPRLFLSRIDRMDQTIIAVGPDTALAERDVLVFIGDVDSVVDLQRVKGLEPVAGGGLPEHHDRPSMKLVEAVVSSASPLVGRSIRDSEIRTRYGAVVVAVHRLGHRLEGKVGDIVLRAGDTLLLEADKSFARRYRRSPDFYLVSALGGAATPRHGKAWLAVAILAGLVLVMSGSDWPIIRDIPVIGGMTEAVAALGAALAMIAMRCCTGPQARAGIEWPVLIVIGSSFGLGQAMQNTGLASTIAGLVTSAAGPLGPWGLIGAVYLLTLGFTTLISNNAAAALMFPIALGMAEAGGHDFMPFAVTIALAASLEFMTPLGYQTNLMVMAPGGYRWGDFLRYGGPLTAITAAASIALTPIVFPLDPPAPPAVTGSASAAR